jgi:outer membrane protein OmpA-like peptidoglycan-associated protein
MSSSMVPDRARVSAAGTAGMTRLVRQVEDAPSVLWLAMVPALGFAVLTWFGTGPFAVNEVEATVAREVRSRLQQKGFDWVNVAVGGQEVLLSGVPPEPGAGEEALAVSRSATCPTWAGPQVCAVAVLGAFGAAGSAAMPGASSLPSLPSLSPLASSPSSPSSPSLPTTPAPAASTSAPTPSPAVAACDAAFAGLLAHARIEFASGDSAIDARSARLLDRLAEAAGGCPGKVRIEGHTDSVGDATDNQRLSEARAAAVREALLRRGLPAERLQAVGHGDTQPLADNAGAAGRAANRRIDFKAVP